MLQPNSNHLRNCGIFKKRRTRSGEDITAVLWGELNCGYQGLADELCNYFFTPRASKPTT